MDRRSFLKKGLLGGALLALGGTGLALYPTRRIAAPLKPLLVLDERGFQVLLAAAGRIVTVPGADLVSIVHSVDDYLTGAPPDAQQDLLKLLGLFESALPRLILDGRVGPFTRLDGPAQDRVLESWRDSRLTLRRGGYQVIRKLLLVNTYKDPRTWAGLHYPGPPDTAGFTFDDSRAGTPAWIAEQAAKGSAP